MLLDRSNTTRLGHWWWTIDRFLLMAIAAIMVIGLVLVMAASPAKAEHLRLHSFHFVYRQIVFLGISAALMLVISGLPVVWLRRASAIGFLLFFLLMLYVVLFGQEIKGAKSWIHLPGFALQPSEFMKPFFVMMTAWALSRRHMIQGFPGFPVAILLYAMVSGLMMLQPDFGMTLLVTAVWGSQIFIAGLPIIWIILIGAGGIVGIVGAYFTFDHVRHRIHLFMNPASGDNYQVDKAQEAIMNGGLAGVGPGGGVIKGSVPDAHADFIFAVAGEEFGILFCTVLVLLFAFVIIRSLIKIAKDTDLYIVYAATGLITLFGLQAIINIGVTLGLIPNTGMTLPLVSYGGSATIASGITIGLILALTRKRYGTV